MSIWKRLMRKLLRRKVEEHIAEELVRRHWPAVEETLRREFAGPCLEVALRAARRACERLVEHIV